MSAMSDCSNGTIVAVFPDPSDWNSVFTISVAGFVLLFVFLWCVYVGIW